MNHRFAGEVGDVPLAGEIAAAAASGEV